MEKQVTAGCVTITEEREEPDLKSWKQEDLLTDLLLEFLSKLQHVTRQSRKWNVKLFFLQLKPSYWSHISEPLKMKQINYAARLVLPSSGTAAHKYTMDLCLGLDCFTSELAVRLEKAKSFARLVWSGSECCLLHCSAVTPSDSFGSGAGLWEAEKVLKGKRWEALCHSSLIHAFCAEF